LRELRKTIVKARVCVEAVKSALEKMSWPSQAVEMLERWRGPSGRVTRAARKLLGGDQVGIYVVRSAVKGPLSTAT
jgi:hypothetical protein